MESILVDKNKESCMEYEEYKEREDKCRKERKRRKLAKEKLSKEDLEKKREFERKRSKGYREQNSEAIKVKEKIRDKARRKLAKDSVILDERKRRRLARENLSKDDLKKKREQERKRKEFHRANKRAGTKLAKEKLSKEDLEKKREFERKRSKGYSEQHSETVKVKEKTIDIARRKLAKESVVLDKRKRRKLARENLSKDDLEKKREQERKRKERHRAKTRAVTTSGFAVVKAKGTYSPVQWNKLLLKTGILARVNKKIDRESVMACREGLPPNLWTELSKAKSRLCPNELKIARKKVSVKK
jgi:hypothetical protein